MENNTQQMNAMQNRAMKEYGELVNNGMGILPYAVCYEISSTLIEDTIKKWLEFKNIDTSDIIIRCVLKKSLSNSPKFIKAVRSTALPFIVMIFRSFDKKIVKTNNNVDEEVRRVIARSLHNFKDSAQVSVTGTENDPLTISLSELNGNGDPIKWIIEKRNRQLFCFVNPDCVLATCFKLDAKYMEKNMVVDIMSTKQRINPRTRYQEFTLNVGLSHNVPKKKPMRDPISYIR